MEPRYYDERSLLANIEESLNAEGWHETQDDGSEGFND
jgi:hypothetical protein